MPRSIAVAVREGVADPVTVRFQILVEAKYTRGLTQEEKREFATLESKLDEAAEEFYRPILDRAGAALARQKLALPASHE